MKYIRKSIAALCMLTQSAFADDGKLPFDQEGFNFEVLGAIFDEAAEYGTTLSRFTIQEEPEKYRDFALQSATDFGFELCLEMNKRAGVQAVIPMRTPEISTVVITYEPQAMWARHQHHVYSQDCDNVQYDRVEPDTFERFDQ